MRLVRHARGTRPALRLLRGSSMIFWTTENRDHVFVWANGALILKTYRDGGATILFPVAPSQAVRLP